MVHGYILQGSHITEIIENMRIRSWKKLGFRQSISSSFTLFILRVYGIRLVPEITLVVTIESPRPLGSTKAKQSSHTAAYK